MAREDFAYINFKRDLVEIVDCCVTNIFVHGERKYANRRDFAIKALQAQIESDKEGSYKIKKLLKQQPKKKGKAS